ncbi:1348_t:CDS:2, partial [Acaulospora morrowiae]
SSAPVTKKRSISKVLNVPTNIPLQDSKSIDILKNLKTAVHNFDQGIITLGSSCSYKSSNHLYVNSEHYIKVPRKSTYDAEIYWHPEQVCDDGNYHHLYCDPTIKKLILPIWKLFSKASIPKLNVHFKQVFKYEKQLHPREIWILHFSCEDFVVSDPYWPCEKLQLEVKNDELKARVAELEDKQTQRIKKICYPYHVIKNLTIDHAIRVFTRYDATRDIGA